MDTQVERTLTIKYFMFRNISPNIQFPIGFFYGVAHGNFYGCGAWLRICNRTHFKLTWHCGSEKNTRVEILALWGFLSFSKRRCMECIHIHRDSKSIIDGVMSHTNFTPPNLCS